MKYVAAAYLAGSQQFIGNTIPLLLGFVFERTHPSVVELGAVNSAYTFAALLLALSTPLWATRFSGSILNWLASVGIVASFLTLGVVSRIESMSWCFATAGICSGIMGGAGHAVIGTSQMPARWYGISMAFQMATSALYGLLVPALVMPLFGPSVALMAMAALFLPCIVASAVLKPNLIVAASVSANPPDAPAEDGSWVRRLALWLAFASCFVYSVGAVAYWIFLERLGNEAGLSIGYVGLSVSASSLVAMIGAIAAARSRQHVRRTLLMGFSATLAAYFLALLPGRVAFFTSVCAFNLGWAVCIPALQTIIRCADYSNRLYIANQAPVFLAGTITGPIAGWFAASVGHHQVAYFCIAGTVISLIMTISAIRTTRQSTEDDSIVIAPH